MAIIVPILSTFDPKGVNQADKSFAGITKQANILKTALAGIGIAATVKGLQSTVMAASNLSESIAKSNTVFGKNAEAIQDWSKTTASALGVSRQAALEAAGTYGNLFRAFGINESESARMSTALVTLAADLASFNNVPIEDALLALRSGLSGETEPLKRFGIALNEARLKEQALADGLIKTTKGTLPQAIKTQAAYSLIMKDSALAQGDVARTAGGLANQLKFLKAGLDDAKAGFGEALLPIVLNVVTALNKDLLPAIQNTTRAFGEQGVAGGFKTAGVEVANLLSNMTGLAKVIKDVVLALVGMKIAAVALAVAPPIIRGMTVAMETLYVATLLGAGGFNALKVAISGALASTGIGLLIVGLGLVVGKLIEMRLQAGATDKTVRFMESNGVQAFRNMGDAAYIANQKIAGNIITLNAVSLAASRAADEVDNIGIKRVKLGRVPPIAVPVPDAVTTSTTKATKAVVGLSDAAKLAQSNMAKLGDELSKSNDILSKAKDAYGNFKNTVSTAISSILDFGSAQTRSTDSISNAKDAQIELAKAQIEYDKSLKTDNIEAQEDALKSLQDAQKAATDSVTNRKTFLQVLQDQASLASTFSDKVKTLISMGLSETAIGQVLQAGADAGTKIADEIIAGGATVVDQVNTLTSATQSVADAVGESAATQFYSAGIAAGQALVDGVKAAIAAAGLSVTATGTIVNQAGIDQVNSAIAKARGKKSKSGTKISKGERQSIMDLAASLGVEVPAFAKGGIVTGPTLALIGEAGPEAVVPLSGRNAGGLGSQITINVNAGMGADGASIGRDIVDAIKRYERTSGPVFASA
jgi:predicted transcriptional regulator